MSITCKFDGQTLLVVVLQERASTIQYFQILTRQFERALADGQPIVMWLKIIKFTQKQFFELQLSCVKY